MKKDEAVVVLSIFGIFFFSVGVVVGEGALNFKFSDIIGAIATLIAAYAGAHAAFAFQQKKEAEESRRKNIVNINRFLGGLLFRFNMLVQIKQNWVSLSDHYGAGRHVFMPPVAYQDIDKYKINLEDLEILLNPISYLTFFNVSIEIDRSSMAVDLVNKRSKLMAEIVQPLLSDAGLKAGQFNYPKDLEDIIGTAYTEQLRSLTDAAISQINEGIDSMIIAKNGLRDEVKKLYPGAFFLDFEKPKP